MAQSKEFFTRIQHKHDIEENWSKATNFAPLAGEIIVYDKDDMHNYVRIKIGDGNTKINDLPFVRGENDWFQKGSAIADGDDLDTYVNIGKYYASPKKLANNLINCPTGEDNFVLYVFTRTKLKAITQLIITYDGKLYLRSTGENGTLTGREWSKYTTTSDLSALQATIEEALAQKSDKATTLAGYGIADAYTKTEVNAHISNTSNPHSVTKTQVGLGNVPNVATNNQTPTYTAASTLTTLTSGEKLSISMGKIMKAITELISHLANKLNPHGVTKEQVGLGNVENKSSETIRGELIKANVTAALGYTPAEIDWFGKGTAFTSGQNLDNFKTKGIYYASDAKTAQSLVYGTDGANVCPATTNFKMYVFSRTSDSSIINQLILAQNKIYMRGCTSKGVWSSWSEYATASALSNLQTTVENTYATKTALKETDDKFAGCWIEFKDENGNLTDEPYIHYAVDENGNPVYTGIPYAEDGEF